MRHARLIHANTRGCAAARQIALFAVVAALAACGGGGDGADGVAESSIAPSPVAAPAPAPAPAPPGPAPAPAPATAVLSWTASENAGVTGYRIYHGTASRSYIQASGSGVPAGNATSFTLTGLQRGQTHYFAVTAIDDLGNESAFSNEETKLIQ